ADRLAHVPDAAPPAFLLDARRGGVEPRTRGVFDNRSFCTSSDFPSAETLLRADIRRVLLLQDWTTIPATDLAPTLRDWQKAGLDPYSRRLHPPDPMAPLVPLQPPFPRRLREPIVRAFVFRHRDGSFGTRPPTAGG